MNALHISVRICSVTSSWTEKFLARLKLQFQTPSARKAPGLKFPGLMGAPDALATRIRWKAADPHVAAWPPRRGRRTSMGRSYQGLIWKSYRVCEKKRIRLDAAAHDCTYREIRSSCGSFKITGLTWIVERTFAWLGRNRRLSKDYEYAVQSSETMIDIAAVRLMLNRLSQRRELFKRALRRSDLPRGQCARR